MNVYLRWALVLTFIAILVIAIVGSWSARAQDAPLPLPPGEDS